MNILFIGYGKTSQHVAKQLFAHGHHIYTISRSAKTDAFAHHEIQDVHQLHLCHLPNIDWVYVLLSPDTSTVAAYQDTFVDAVRPIISALQQHNLKRVVVVSSTRVYGESEGQWIDDDTVITPVDEQGMCLRQMEQLWLQAYPEQVTIIRPSGIYGRSVQRMKRLAETTTSYNSIHWSNRIHLDDLVGFLVFLTTLKPQKIATAYIVSNSQPVALHQVLQWFQQQLHLPSLILQSERYTGKRIFAKRLQDSGFQLQHPDCFQDYLQLLQNK
ncbi:MAG: NAD-dependent epimerase/dehydratase family protein [Acinetobacter sp.]